MDQLKIEEISLRFERPQITTPSLQQQIQQLIKQKGALRHITEQSLRTEIDQSAAKDKIPEYDQQGENDGEDDSDNEKPQARQERVWKAREDMLQKLAYAQNEILSALDFVSLLLSGNSSVAQTSMSPALKQHVPVGTLERHTVDEQAVSVVNRRTLTQVSEGWRSETFNSAAAKLNQAGVRLEGEAQRQATYWDQIADLKSQGWSISRLPSDSRVVGVHYGFSEAAARFRNRGFAYLQQEESGDLQLHAGAKSETQSVISIMIIRDGVQTGSSKVWSLKQEDGISISEQTRKARDLVFEEELFHEISREARLIANQGVRTQSQAVEADIDRRTQVRIVQSNSHHALVSEANGPDDQLATCISLNLRLLLLLEHKKSRQRRSMPPSVMSLTPPAAPEYALLRPLLAHLRHQASVDALCLTSRQLASTCASAGVTFDFKITTAEPSDQTGDTQSLRKSVKSTYTANLLNGRAIKMDLETYLGPPIYGTVIRSSDMDFGFVQFQSSSFKNVDEAVEYLGRATTLELMSQTQDFEILQPHSGQVTLKTMQQVVGTVVVRPQRISFSVTSPQKTLYTWKASGFQQFPDSELGKARSFQEVVDLLVKNHGSKT